METKVLDTPHFLLEMPDGILFLTYKGKITLEIAKEVVKSRMKFTQGKSYPLLILGIAVSAFEKEARDYLASDEGIAGVKAGAIVADSIFHSFLGKFFLKVSKPKMPARIFSDKEKALKWLEQFK